MSGDAQWAQIHQPGMALVSKKKPLNSKKTVKKMDDKPIAVGSDGAKALYGCKRAKSVSGTSDMRERERENNNNIPKC